MAAEPNVINTWHFHSSSVSARAKKARRRRDPVEVCRRKKTSKGPIKGELNDEDPKTHPTKCTHAFHRAFVFLLFLFFFDHVRRLNRRSQYRTVEGCDFVPVCAASSTNNQKAWPVRSPLSGLRRSQPGSAVRFAETDVARSEVFPRCSSKVVVVVAAMPANNDLADRCSGPQQIGDSGSQPGSEQPAMHWQEETLIRRAQPATAL